MYFDARLWRLTRGLRAGMAGGILLGLLALAAGIARYVFLGLMLARVFDGAPWNDWAWPAAGAALMVLRSQLDHWRTVQAQRASAAIQLRCAASCTTASSRWGRPGSRASAPAA